MKYFTNKEETNKKNLAFLLKEYNKEIFSKFPKLPPSEEIPERLAVVRHLNPQSKVLEIGANKGGVSATIASVLDDSKNLVSVEPIQSTCEGLKDVGLKIGKPFRIFCGVLRGESAEYITCDGEKNSFATCVTSSKETTETINLTFKEIEELFSIQFDTVVIDCEGCYTHFLQDIVQNENIKQIQIEWDGEFKEEEILKNGFSLLANYYHIDLPKGVRVYERGEN
jgi:hypothetical protein